MKRKIQVDLSFFSEKNTKDRLNAIVRFVLSLGNMSKVLYRNKNTGLCREKNIQAQKHLPAPHKYQMVTPLTWLGRLNALIYSVSDTKLQKKIFRV